MRPELNIVELLRDQMIRNKGLARTVSSAAERFGAQTLADHADDVLGAGDIVAVRIPHGSNDLRSRRIKMWRHGDRDLIAASLRQGWRMFEHPLPDLFVTEVRHNHGAVFDVGANTGLYSLLGAACGAQSVHAFEPYAPVAELLRRNLAINASRCSIHVVESALAAHEGRAVLYVPEPTADNAIESSASLSATFKEIVVEALSVEVEVTTADSYWRSVGSPHVSVMKIDVESRESDVLLGANQMIASDRPIIFYELLIPGDAQAISAFAVEHNLIDMYASSTEIVVNTPIDFHSDAWNHVLVPWEKLDYTVDRYRRLGIKVTLC
jgi:FkbM family methyltransferase